MMSVAPAIRVEGLSKRYRIGLKQMMHDTLRDAVADQVRSGLKRLRGKGPVAERDDIIWALRDVSFEIQRGEVVGIIGRNGAGKSTFLKVLSRITEPTSGRVELRGRVSSLLEVGTGFHPELTGRENIFLNGAILGMARQETKRKFDEIVAFSEIGKFLDTPVKRYSSGMYVRLAFAVAAHLEPEILLVDEVLAVGDAQFQRKCLGKMGDVAHEGRTVVFVSHNMDAIRRLCKRAIWLDGGEVIASTDPHQCISQYLHQGIAQGATVAFDPPHQLANGMPLLLHSVTVSDEEGHPRTLYSRTSRICVHIAWQNSEPLYKPRIGFVMQTANGTDVLTAMDATSWDAEWLPPGRRVSSCAIPEGLLNEDGYTIDVGADSPNRADFTRGRTGAILRFEVEDDMTVPWKYYGQEGFRDQRAPGVVLLDLPWRQKVVQSGDEQSC